jgi:hypothetical protein
MNAATLKWLAIVTIGLLLLMVLVDQTDRSDTVSSGEYLFPDLKAHINDVNEVIVTADAGAISIVRDGDRWQVKEKDGFPADIGKLRQVMLALADARKLEKKTADPERFAQLGVEGPDTGEGTLLAMSGPDLRFDVIIGNVAQSKNRYVRLANDNQCWLIDKNPNLPAAASGWLASKLLDIDSSRIRSVDINHEDGERLQLTKASPGDANFSVLDIPQGRELNYATVANGIAGVLGDLTLEDVRRGDGDPDDAHDGKAGEVAASSVFTTFDGLEVRIRRLRDEEDGSARWLTIAARYLAPPGDEAKPIPAEESTSGEIAIDDPSKDSAASISAEEEAAAINAQHAGWQYRIPEYKANLLARRWKDILKEKE